jgi:hypothetical protein
MLKLPSGKRLWEKSPCFFHGQINYRPCSIAIAAIVKLPKGMEYIVISRKNIGHGDLMGGKSK